MQDWRYLDLGFVNLPMLHAIEEAIAKTEGLNTFMLWIASPPTISVGYFQSVEEEVNAEACKKLGIEISRRPCGGGAAYFDERELYYSVIVKNRPAFIPESIAGSFEAICKGLIYALQEFGVNATFSGKNDILVNGRKISGNAQTRRWNTIITHGTFLVDFDFDSALSVSKISLEKFRDKAISSLRERVTTLKSELKREFSIKEVKSALEKGFARALNANFIQDELKYEEIQLAQEFRKRYASQEWIFRR